MEPSLSGVQSNPNNVNLPSNDRQTKDFAPWKVATVIAIVVALGGVGLSIFQMLQLSNANTRLGDLEAEVSSLQEQLEQECGVCVQDPATPGNANADSGANNDKAPRKYLEPEGWDVRFAYPDGVTDVQYSLQDDPWNGVLYIESVAKDGKVYNVDLFGGEDSYRHYPFFFGAVARWNSANSQDIWSGWVTDAPLLFDNSGYRYYISGGNGHESGAKSEYEYACSIVKDLLENIEAK